MLATLLSVVQIFGSLNCLLMWSVCLDLTACFLSLFPALLCAVHAAVRCGDTFRYGAVRIGFVSDCVCCLPSCLWEPFHVSLRVRVPVFAQIRFHLPVAFFTLFAN